MIPPGNESPPRARGPKARGRGQAAGGQAGVAVAFVRAINRHDPGRISRLIAKGYTFIDSRGAEHTGRSEALAGWRQYFRMFPDYKIKVDHVAEGAGFAALFGSARGTYNGRRGMVPGNRIKMPAAWRAVAKDGRIVLWQVFADWTEGVRIIKEDAKSR